MALSIDDLRKIATTRGGDCLGPSQSSAGKKFVWKCNKGHKWEAVPYSVIGGTWCPICYRTRPKKTIRDMKTLARKHGGDCISPVYVDSRTRLSWICSEGHVFEASPAKLIQGRWCRICGNKAASASRRTKMEEIWEIAISRKGKCLSDKYNPKENLKWKCEYGHTWNASIHNVKRGSWCPVCGHKKSGRKRLSLDEMKVIAASHGGKCLSETYINVETKLKWECEKGHVWMAIPSAIKKGSWCPVCSGRAMLDLKQMQKTAKERGGKCLSTSYHGVHKKLLWQCAEGHTWQQNYTNISIGRWCPECSAGLGERITREYFEQLFGNKFPKARPSWLINQDGYQMELDGYCSKLALAFEHQGSQHYRQDSYFYKTKSQFQKRQADDRKKKALCKKNGITLIEIPQIPDSLAIMDVQHFILNRCKVNGIEIPQDAEAIKVKFQKAFSPNAKEKMKEIQKIANAQGGKCLTSVYISGKIKLRFKCAEGHKWETIPDVIMKGHWCPDCGALKASKNRRLNMDEMHELAKEHGGLCLSQEYVNANTPLLWQCKNGHQWKAIPNSIKRGSWCSICSRDNHRKQKYNNK